MLNLSVTMQYSSGAMPVPILQTSMFYMDPKSEDRLSIYLYLPGPVRVVQMPSIVRLWEE